MSIKKTVLIKKIKKEDTVIVYGAGQIGQRLINWLLREGVDTKKIIVAVTQLNGNPKEICGITVQSIENVSKSTKRDALLIIGTFSSFHEEIELELRKRGYDNIVKLSDDFYSNLNHGKRWMRNFADKKLEIYEKIVSILFDKRKLKNYILFESHDDFDGNSGALCQKIIENGWTKKYKMIWLVREPEKFKNMKKSYLRFQKIAKDSSFWDVYYHHRAKYIFYDNRPIRKRRADQISVYLTHGTNPLKNVKGIINLPTETDYILVTSNEMLELGLDQYGMTREKYFVCGQPRSDLFFDRKEDINKLCLDKRFNAKVIWMPTFRQHCRTSRCDSERVFPFGIPIIETKEELQKLENFLKEKNILLIIKPHPIQNLDYIKIQNSQNILVLPNYKLKELDIDIYGLLAGTDAMISDYSNVTFDYLLGDNQIAYARANGGEYKLAFEKNFEEYMMGPTLYTVDDIIEFLNDVVQGRDEYKEKREIVRGKVHKYIDNKNAERVLEFLGIGMYE